MSAEKRFRWGKDQNVSSISGQYLRENNKARIEHIMTMHLTFRVTFHTRLPTRQYLPRPITILRNYRFLLARLCKTI